MQHRTTVRLIASDPRLYWRAAYTLAAADYEVIRPEAGLGAESDLVVRHWAERGSDSWSNSAPELTLDLSLISGSALLAVVARVVGRSVEEAVRQMN